MHNLFENYQVPNGNRRKSYKKQLAASAVDQLADELVREYNNLNFRRWYCGIIYDFGPEQVHEWRRRAKEGQEPAKLFCKYVKDARTFKGSRSPAYE